MRKLLQPFFSLSRWILCHWEVGRRFTAWYKKFRIERLTMKNRKRLQKRGTSVLKHIHDILSSAGVPYYLEYGSMLGAVREKHFIRHDDDLDFGLPPDAISAKQLYTLVTRKGLKFDKAFAWRGLITEVSFFYKNIPIDFFMTFNIGGKVQGFSFDKFVVREGKHVAQIVKHLWKPDFKGVHEIDFMGVPTLLLNYAEESLTRTYGDWKTPVENFRGKDKDVYRISVEDEAEMLISAEELMQYPEKPSASSSQIVDDWFEVVEGEHLDV